MDPKTQWRQVVLEQRRHLKPDFVAAASRKIAAKFFSLEEVGLSERIGLYSAFRNEVETASIFAEANALRKEIFYPAVDTRAQEIHFYRVHSLKELHLGFARILEPVASRHPLANINYLDLIVVPGLLFDKEGNRIGFGGGYYDRLLGKFRGKKIALAFDFQVVEALPTSPRDQRVDGIVTEERIIKII